MGQWTPDLEMASLTKKNDQYFVGREIISHKRKNTDTVIGSKEFEEFLNTYENFEYFVGYVPAGYAHRPDLIANVFYGSPANWWLILRVNNISDPFEGLNVGDRILIPLVDGFTGNVAESRIFEEG